ncbi:hypothetical protein ISS04_03680 [Candidatus Woesearchaeota archaeon]|nr:hypothetical protein [Candidatus Woesearchaeota archaeon]
MEIKDLQARQGNVEIVATVKDISEPREFEKFGKTGKVANATIADESGQIKLTLWNEQIDQVKLGNRIHIKNGYVGEWQSELQLSTGKFGSLEVLEGEESPSETTETTETPSTEETSTTEEVTPEEPTVEEEIIEEPVEEKPESTEEEKLE